MSKYRKPFIKELKRHWEQRFPLWRAGICKPVFWASKDATFTNDSTLAKSGLVFHAVIDFTPKWPGAFTCDVIVASTLEPLGGNPPHRWPDDIATESIPGVDAAALALKRQPHDWYAPSYAVELAKVIGEASQHFSDTFEHYVLPKLHPNT